MKKVNRFQSWFKKLPLAAKVFSLAVILGLGWFLSSKLGAGGKNGSQYQTAQVERGTLIVSTAASGQVTAANSATVTTQVSGVVEKVYVSNGDAVRAGQQIAKIVLDQSSLQKQSQAWSSYLSAKNSLESARATAYSLDSQMWAANRKLINDAVARGLVVEDPTYIQEHDDWLAAEAKYKNQTLAISQAQAALNSAWYSYQQNSSVITVPISGRVGDLSLRPGTVISVTTGSNSSIATSGKIATIRTEGTPSLTVSLSEIDAPKIKIGNQATVTFDAHPDKTYTGKVLSLDTTGAVASGVTTYPVTIGLDTQSPEIFANMSATANIIAQTKADVLLVPNSAVQNQDGQTTVRILNKGKLESVTVEIGLASDTQTEIVSGLEEGAEVVTAVISANTSKSSSGSASPFGAFRVGGMGGQQRQFNIR